MTGAAVAVHVRDVTIRKVSLLALVVLGVAGCQSNDLGACDEAAAAAVYYQDGVGLPMYAGQALIYASCGRGAFCHSEGARGPARYGVPLGLDFVMQPDKGATRATPGDLARLSRGQHNTYDARENLYERVVGGQMPPGGAAQRETVDAQPARFHDAAGALPAIGSAAGQEILRNWLACRAPVVERTAPLSTGGLTVGSVEPCEDGSAGSCLCPSASFASIYDVLIQPQCGSVCHTPDVPTQFARSQLDLSTRELAYRFLVTESATAGDSCMGDGRRRVIAGDPDHSVLVNKLENCDPTTMRSGTTGTPVCDVPGGRVTGGIVCGDIMPLGGPATGLGYECFIAPVRQWIRNGAPND